jgi:hypothetical protein
LGLLLLLGLAKFFPSAYSFTSIITITIEEAFIESTIIIAIEEQR